MQPKIPPNSLDAEKSVLASILIDKDAIINVADILRIEYFYDEHHSQIYEAMQTLYEKRQPIDVVTLTDQLKKNKKLSAVGGASAIVELSNAVSTAANIVHYAQIIKDLAIKRAVISLSSELTTNAFDESKEVKELINDAEQRIFELSQDNTTKSFTPIKQALAESFERLDELQRNAGELRGVASGFADLDNLLAGFQRSNLIILAARPGIGKTAFSMNMAQYAAVVAKKKIGFFSLEMSREELVDRLLVSQADIDAWRLKTGRLDQQDYLKLSDAMGVLADAQIFIDDSPGLSIFEMRTKARRLMAEQGIDMLIVDYLQLAHGRTFDNRVQEVAEISQGLKNIARELKIPVLALSQLSRAIESRGEKTPQLSDLRESGCITGDSLITLVKNGQQVSISQLKGKKDFAVWSLNPETYKLESALVSNAFSTGVKPVFQLTTRLGRAIKATANHKFLTINGWKRLDELVEKECLALPRSIPVTTSVQTMSDAELGLLGHLIGDGCTLPRHAIQYTTRELDLADVVSTLALQVFGSEVKPRINKERQCYQVYLASTRKHGRGVHSPISDWLRELEVWGLRSYEKFVPKKVFEQSTSAVAVFLKHLWATDGCIKMQQSKKPYPAIYYASSSLRLASDVQSLLLKLGINASLRKVPQPGKGRDQHHVILSGVENLSLFVHLIGAVGSYKSNDLNLVQKYLSGIHGNTNFDIIPSDVWTLSIKPSMRHDSITYRQLCDLTHTARSGAMFGQNLGRGRAMLISKVVQSASLLSLASSDVYWDSVREIKYLGEEEVFDLTVPGHENFVANNIVVHNSIEQDADVVMFLYRKDDDIRESVNLKIAKHRNGPLGEIDLYFKGDRIKFFGMEARR